MSLVIFIFSYKTNTKRDGDFSMDVGENISINHDIHDDISLI